MNNDNQIIDTELLISGQTVLNPETFCIDTLMDELYAFVEQKLQSTGKSHIRLEYVKYGCVGKCFAYVDGDALRQILCILLDNAVKFTKTGYIFFGFRFGGDNERLVIFIDDTGAGIPQNKMPFIFENTNQRDKGRSGLFTANALVQLMGGNIEARSTNGAGSSFHVILACKSFEVFEN